MKDATGLSLPARAKLNLVLRVVGRRADGYHLLETLFHAIELHDDVEVALADRGIALEVTAEQPGLAVPAGEGNLVVRALQRLAATAGHGGGFAARLHKRIPHGAGLGGGSSDAAAALQLGNRLLGAPLGDRALHELAATLGADVPFFLRGGSQWGRGIGDELTPASVPPRHFVLVVPPFGCPTAAVYENLAAHWKSGAAQDTVPRVTGPDTRDSAVHTAFDELTGFHNDLQQAAERIRPELAVLRRRLAEAGLGGVHMTGSGSTLFLAFDSAAAAGRAAEQVERAAGADVRVVATRSVSEGIDDARRVGGPRSE